MTLNSGQVCLTLYLCITLSLSLWFIFSLSLCLIVSEDLHICCDSELRSGLYHSLCLTVHLSNWSASPLVPLCQRLPVPPPHCLGVSPSVSLSLCLIVSLPFSVSASMSHCFTIPLSCSPSVPLSYFLTVPLFQCLNVSLFFCLTVSVESLAWCDSNLGSAQTHALYVSVSSVG